MEQILDQSSAPLRPRRAHGWARRGNALVITMVVMASLVALFTFAADNVIGQAVLAQVDLDRQRATYAAETMAALIEAKLHERAADLRNLKLNVDEDPSAWWNLVGCSYTHVDNAGVAELVKPEHGLWINGCVVRWRVEPVKIYSKTLAASESTNGATYTVNPEPDANLETVRTDAATALEPDNTLSDQNEFYHYRIVTEAYALKNNEDASAQPWDHPEQRVCSVQVQRVSQLKILCLFKYALFYAAEGPTGDISSLGFQQIYDGSVHSNGAIYCGGKSLGGQFWYPAPNYHYHAMASGEWPSTVDLFGTAQNTNLGTALKKITVTGVDGIFRLCKWADYYAAYYNQPFASRNPWSIPTDSSVWPDRRLILNSDVPGDAEMPDYKFCPDRVHINGIIMPPEHDSRMPADQQTRFSNRVRDKNNNGKVVKTLANFPALSGRPLEAQRIGQRGAQLYQRADGTRTVDSNAAEPLYYSSNPRLMAGAAAVQTDPATLWPVTCEDMPVYWNDTFTETDVIVPPFQDNDFPGVAANGDGFADREAKGFYLEKALFGANVTSKQYYTMLPNPPVLASTGLVFREKSAQNPVMVKPAQGDLANYAAYMKSQYTVLFAGHNITDQFFSAISAAAGGATETVWVEDGLPAGASSSAPADLVLGDGTNYHEEGWTWLSEPVPAPFSGTVASQSANQAGVHQHYFYSATTTMTVNAGDTVYAYVYLDPAHLPSEIMLQWNDGSWDHRAYWGSNSIPWGTDGTTSLHYMGVLPAAGAWTRLEVPAADVALEGSTVNGMAFTMSDGAASWDHVGHSSGGVDDTWVEDSVPAGATADGTNESWVWIGDNPSPYSENLCSSSDVFAEAHQHYFWNAPAMTANTGDALFVYVYIDPANVPNEIMLQWYAGTWEHRAYWGSNNLAWGVDGTISLHPMGALPASGAWVRLEVPASDVGLEGVAVSGFAFTLHGGRAWIDKIGCTSPPPPELIATEDEFVNARESGYMAAFYGINPSDFPAGTGQSYHVTTLTLNLRLIQDWLRTTLVNEDLGMTEFPAGMRAKTCFNGLIYAARTRRSQTYHPLNHPDLFFDPAVMPNAGKYSLAPYLGVSYPYQVREGDGPPETFHAGVRLRGGLSKDGIERANHGDVDWDHDADNDGVDDARPLGTSGLSIVTPNHLYLWGDFNTTPHPDSGGTLRRTPCAVMCDMNTKLSANWSDDYWQIYNNGGFDLFGGGFHCTYNFAPAACTTSYICSFVSNNIPCDDWNLPESGEYGAFIQDCTTLECWRNPANIFQGGYTTQFYSGSYVVLNSTRYTKALHSYIGNYLNNYTRVSETDLLDMHFNTDLFTQAGQPPFSPYGVEVSSVINTINVLDN